MRLHTFSVYYEDFVLEAMIEVSQYFTKVAELNYIMNRSSKFSSQLFSFVSI